MGENDRPFVAAGTYNITGCVGLGFTLIKEEMRFAAWGATSATVPVMMVQRVSLAQAFIWGTALEVTLRLFSVPWSSEQLRSGLETYMERHPYGPETGARER